jgi:uncharacterized protein
MITFSVSRLEKENIRLEGSEPPEFIVLADGDCFTVASDVSYALDISKVSGGALVSGTAGVTIAGECGRCLAPVSREVVAGEFRFFVETPPGMEVCDISDDVRTEITLALPMNLLCRDDCRGLCPKCGADLNRETCSCKPNLVRGSGVWDALDDLKL